MSTNPNSKTLKAAMNIGRSKSVANVTKVDMKRKLSIKRVVTEEEKLDLKLAGLGKKFNVLIQKLLPKKDDPNYMKGLEHN